MSNRSLQGWKVKSFKLPDAKDYPLLTFNFQTLGRMDINLSSEWELIKNDLDEIPNVLKFDQHSLHSSLWVMGAYELLNILRRIDTRPEVDEAFQLFRRVRVPMVKSEPVKNKGVIAYPDDIGIARPAIGNNDKALGWAVAPNVFISRNELADSLYKLYSEDL